jgi:hypothetical protein
MVGERPLYFALTTSIASQTRLIEEHKPDHKSTHYLTHHQGGFDHREELPIFPPMRHWTSRIARKSSRTHPLPSVGGAAAIPCSEATINTHTTQETGRALTAERKFEGLVSRNPTKRQPHNDRRLKQMTLPRLGTTEGGNHQPFFRANRLLSKLSTFGTLNWTYSRSRSSWLSFCISSKSSSLRSSSNRPRLRPGMSNVSKCFQNRNRIQKPGRDSPL